MKPSLAVVLAFGLPLSAQEKPSAKAEELPQLRAAFAALAAGGPALALACVGGGEPVILTTGTDAGGQELSPKSLMPLLGLAKVLAADAIATQHKDKVDKGSGEKLGGRELTVRELLDGTTLLPDYFVLDGNEGSASTSVLRACGDLAVGAKMQLRATTLGAAEFVLLEPLAFGGRYKDWQSMLRSTFAPRVPGLDPLSADTLPDADRTRALLAAEDLGKLAAARPSLLRTLLSVKDVATWWQWRSQQEGLAWASARMGRPGTAVTKPGEQRWLFSCMAMNMSLQAFHYPSRKAGLIWLGPSTPQGRMGNTRVVQAFEQDLFPPAEGEAGAEARAGALLAAGGFAAVPAPPRPGDAGGPLAGTRWRSAAAAGGSPDLQLAFGSGGKDPLVLTHGSDTSTLSTPTKAGDGFTASGRTVDNGQRTLWLWPQPDADKPTRLSAVMVTTRMAGMATAAGASSGSSVPQFVELLPEPK
jgi:hypothetical protein